MAAALRAISARLSGVAWRAITVAFLIALPSSAARADDTVGLKFFREKIEPVLKAQCYACHSRQAEEVQGGLRLDFKAGVLRGGDSGHLNEFIYFR